MQARVNHVRVLSVASVCHRDLTWGWMGEVYDLIRFSFLWLPYGKWMVQCKSEAIGDHGSPNENCATLKRWFTDVSVHQHHQEGLLKKSWLGSNQFVSVTVDGVGPTPCKPLIRVCEKKINSLLIQYYKLPSKHYFSYVLQILLFCFHFH